MIRRLKRAAKRNACRPHRRWKRAHLTLDQLLRSIYAPRLRRYMHRISPLTTPLRAQSHPDRIVHRIAPDHYRTWRAE